MLNASIHLLSARDDFAYWINADRDGLFIGTLDNPIIVNGAGDEQYAGCTGYPADSHQVNWLTVSSTSHAMTWSAFLRKMLIWLFFKGFP